MKKSFTVAILASLFLMPIAVNGQSREASAQAPSVAQNLIREGDFAVKLVDTLRIGKAENEAEAESILASAGIAPRNGWIADYPVTPDIIGELQNAIGEAAGSGRLAMERNEAVRLFQDATAQAGIPVVAGTQEDYPGDVEARNYTGYPDPSVINDYYYNEGPPVVTYYPPPWDYNYMYAWVPSPFWCSGFFFPGFYVLHDFHKVFVVNRRAIVITNHFRDHRNRRVFRIDPLRRHAGEHHEGIRGTSPRSRFDSPEGKNGASSIFDRSRARATHGNTERTRVERARPGNQTRPPTTDRRISRAPAETGSRDMRNRSFNQGGSIERRHRMNNPNPVTRQMRSFSPPASRSERSSGPPVQSRARSFSSPPAVGRGFIEAPLGMTRGRSRGFGRGLF
jgi:hypothetical protein